MPLPTRDRQCLKFALEMGVDAVSQSFVKSGEDIAMVREAAAALGHSPFIIAKIDAPGPWSTWTISLRLQTAL